MFWIIWLVSLTFLLGSLTFVSGVSITSFNDSISAGNFTWNESGNVTKYFDIPQSSNLTFAYVDLKSFTSIIDEFQNTYSQSWSDDLSSMFDGNWSSYWGSTFVSCSEDYFIYVNYTRVVPAEQINWTVAVMTCNGTESLICNAENFYEAEIYNSSSNSWVQLGTINGTGYLSYSNVNGSFVLPDSLISSNIILRLNLSCEGTRISYWIYEEMLDYTLYDNNISVNIGRDSFFEVNNDSSNLGDSKKVDLNTTSFDDYLVSYNNVIVDFIFSNPGILEYANINISYIRNQSAILSFTDTSSWVVSIEDDQSTQKTFTIQNLGDWNASSCSLHFSDPLSSFVSYSPTPFSVVSESNTTVTLTLTNANAGTYNGYIDAVCNGTNNGNNVHTDVDLQYLVVSTAHAQPSVGGGGGGITYVEVNKSVILDWGVPIITGTVFMIPTEFSKVIRVRNVGKKKLVGKVIIPDELSDVLKINVCNVDNNKCFRDAVLMESGESKFFMFNFSIKEDFTELKEGVVVVQETDGKIHSIDVFVEKTPLFNIINPLSRRLGSSTIALFIVILGIFAFGFLLFESIIIYF